MRFSDELPSKTCFYSIMGDVIANGNKILRITFGQEAMLLCATKMREYKTDLKETYLRTDGRRHMTYFGLAASKTESVSEEVPV